MDFSAYNKIPETFEAVGYESIVHDVKAVFISGALYHGKKTRVFAWYGIPQVPKHQKKVPGIVLLHGGLGTAYALWVKHWNDLGYAAIAIDIFGGLPAKNGDYCSKASPQQHEYSGASFDDKFVNVNWNVENQWCYHAIAAAISARNFLAAQVEVDNFAIGLCGISWGGYIAALTAAFDSNFSFIMPVYACGGSNPLYLLAKDCPKDNVSRFLALWNPNDRLKEVTTPFLWINGANDPFFDVLSWNKTANLAPNSFRLLKPSMIHSQLEGEKSFELIAFANSILTKAKYPKFISVDFNKDKQELVGFFYSEYVVANCQLLVTRASGCWNDCIFRSINASVNNELKLVTANLPDNWTAAYFLINFEFKNNIIGVSSQVVFK